MFELLRLAIALVGTLAAGLWDLKTTDIPDKVVFPMIAAGLLLAAAEGFLSGSWAPLWLALAVSLAFAAFSIIMYLAGAWGGGDGALLVAVGALLPAWPFATLLSFVPFPLVYFFSVFAVGLVYSAVYLSWLLTKSAAARKAFSGELSKIKLAYVPIVALLLLFVPMLPAVFSFVFAVVLLVAPPIYALSGAAEGLFYQKVSAKELKAGDMIGEDLPRLNIFKRQIRGLTEKEVAAIRKMKRSVLVRTGVRYGIVFFLALLALLLLSAPLQLL